MKRYKLIKWYPSLRTNYKEGDILTNYLGEYFKDIWLRHYIPAIEVENNPEFWEEIIEKDYEILKSCPIEGTIYSIKRLSDGEVFTVGDTVDYIHKSHYSPWKIDNFFIKKNTLLARSESSLICEYIKDLKHIKTPIFVTEDNISKYFSDSYYYIVENDRGIIPYAWKVLTDTVTWQNPLKSPLGKIQFHNLEKAEQYIEENKPIYSKKDMLNFGKYVGQY